MTMMMMTTTTIFLFLILLTTACILSTTDAIIIDDEADDSAKEAAAAAAIASAALFEPVDSIRVSAPTQFPKPTRKFNDDTVQVIVEPSFGGPHRPNQDAIFAYAEGYRLPFYMMFMETLTSTGFTGDVVLAIAEERIIKEDVADYLKTFAQGDASKPHVVVYQIPLECDGDPAGDTRRTVTQHGDTDSAFSFAFYCFMQWHGAISGCNLLLTHIIYFLTFSSGILAVFQMCQLNHVYGWKDEMGNVIRTARDARPGRVVATLRYEWYWIWSLQYSAHSWLMLIDARDAYFQTNPFANLPRRQHRNSQQQRSDTSDNNNIVDSGLLYMFGENTNATRLGKSKKNKNWISRGYGQEVMDALDDKPTICSGSTMGEQIAVETYLRALINEHDEGQVKMAGSDQGFHNVSAASCFLNNV
jgi:hypothetical protein